MNYIHNRLITKEVNVGDLGIGGKNPIRIQSMTNKNTLDTDAVVKQTIELVNAECELVRITAPGVAEAENLKAIKKKLRSMGYQVPLIADIHFSAKAAEIAARYVEKVRINPGNYADKKQFKQLDYTDLEYNLELERISERINPLIKICKLEGTVMRIGVNHGSLSDRIISRYGNTPLGMAMSALEYAEICLHFGFENIVFSMKSSDVKIMVYATRMLVNLFHQKNLHFPIHIGVTEAGAGTDGRIRSAAGIGALLSEGIGDTIRVSLTESPIAEIPVAKQIVNSYTHSNFVKDLPFLTPYYPNHNPYTYSIRANFNNSSRPTIITDSNFRRTEDLQIREIAFFQSISVSNFDGHIKNNHIQDQPIVINSSIDTPIQEVKNFISSEFFTSKNPLIFSRDYQNLTPSEISIAAASDIGALAVDGLINGIQITGTQLDADKSYQLSLDILQSTGLRYYKTEIISCPSCGRTNYDIESILREVKQRLSQFEGLKIAVMGCVVNGPGEMSDADYGLVGAGAGEVWLYKGKTPMIKHIPQVDAVDQLVAYIKKDYLKHH